MHRLTWVLILLTSPLAWAGDIVGSIQLDRKFNKKRVVTTVYQLRGAPADAALPLDADSEMERVAVFLTGPKMPAGQPIAATLRQRGRRFDQEVLVVPAGSTVSFPNGDPLFHNVFSLSRSKSFDLGYYPQGQTRAVRFDQPGIVQVYCHLHPAMHAAIVVTPGAWSARPSADGSFSLNDIPAGTYELAVWHNSAGLSRQTITVPASGEIRPTVSIPLLAGQSGVPARDPR
ncbi:MAG: hypothetical protein NTV70_04040 [Acidobacteria bacterium]|nr:hypothetical protein [Acidobacteriota bacterium]